MSNVPQSPDIRTDQRRPNRDPIFDVLKALMMLWVVWGHLGLYGIVGRGASHWMANAKIGVNMPIFFVIGGYLAYSSFQNGTWGKIFARIIGFLWPMAAFGAVFGLVLFAAGHGRSVGWLLRFPLHQVLHGHWFLRTFAAIYLLSAILYRACRSDRTRWLAFAAAYAALLCCPGGLRPCMPWVGEPQTVHMFPYFAFGLLALNRRQLWRSSRAALLCGAFFLSVVLLEGDSTTNGMNFWNVSIHWRAVFLQAHGLLCLFARTAVGIAGSIFLLWAADRMTNRIPGLSRIAVFGTTSLGVYVLHEWPMMRLGQHGFSGLPLPPQSRWPVAIGWFLACHFAIAAIKRIRPLRVFFFGDEQWLQSHLHSIRLRPPRH